MKRITQLAAVLTLATFVGGCGSSGSKEAGVDAGTPVTTVSTFLEAVKTGDDAKAETMLTPLAVEKTKGADLAVSPPGSPSASFSVGEVEMIDSNTAHVASIWTDVGEDGTKQSETFVWVVKLTAEGWRISGMASKPFPDQEPLILNFENPAEMQQKLELAEKEMERREQAAMAQAQKPAAPAAPEKK